MPSVAGIPDPTGRVYTRDDAQADRSPRTTVQPVRPHDRAGAGVRLPVVVRGADLRGGAVPRRGVRPEVRTVPAAVRDGHQAAALAASRAGGSEAAPLR